MFESRATFLLYRRLVIVIVHGPSPPINHCTISTLIRALVLQNLMKTFHCYKPEERQSKLVPLVASLTTYDVFYKVPDTAANSDRDDSEDEAEVKPFLGQAQRSRDGLMESCTCYRCTQPHPETPSP